MPTPKVCVLRAPGTNCDLETAFAFEMWGANAERVHLFRILEKPETLLDYQILCLPGGFSYGDDVGAGVVFSRKLRNPLSDVFGRFLSEDRLVLGICNGFQVLLKSGILPNGSETWPPPATAPATLTWNENGRYTALWVRLRVAAESNVFLRGIEDIELPIAHAEGRFVTHNDNDAAWVEKHIALTYHDANAESSSPSRSAPAVLPFPQNPNGSMANIAGLSDSTGRILGLMPHPERFIHKTQHPNWTRQANGANEEHGAGAQIFRNAVEYFQ
ncbi:phosphoribosylformylglycinamidine synthase subunit PurQ [Thalassoroseus pseudoceratinae]|uniref:phosphoribosylformylglycinamidine synthase subunit PurQ n=1 Tax=Thalassoroseus pseudoceratinae TaxID=2713176 RepID=UPI00141DB932|nr:phosphoribosylformylglycinamidine synthase subunit PurQ [Thalassoroseus pseudoceratinae]